MFSRSHRRRDNKGKSRDEATARSGSTRKHDDIAESSNTPGFYPTAEYEISSLQNLAGETKSDFSARESSTSFDRVEYQDNSADCEPLGSWSEYTWNDTHNCWLSYCLERDSSGQEVYNYQYDTVTPYHEEGYGRACSQVNQGPSYSSYTDTGASPLHYTTQQSTEAQGYAIPHKDAVLLNSEGSQSTFDRYAANEPGSLEQYPSSTSQLQYGSQYEQDDAARSAPQLPAIPILSPVPGCPCEQKDKLCGILIGPQEPKPRYKKSTRNRSSNRSKGKAGSSSTSDKVSTKGPDGKGCGPLCLPGITPVPRPEIPREDASKAEWDHYNTQSDEWETKYEEWKHITCPCRLGYFDVDGLWISGADVRLGKPRNPLWSHNDGLAPETGREVKFRGKLEDRDPI